MIKRFKEAYAAAVIAEKIEFVQLAQVQFGPTYGHCAAMLAAFKVCEECKWSFRRDGFLRMISEWAEARFREP